MSPRARKAGTAARAVTVRMYNTGFGDAFLVTFPAEDRPRKVLIDCGYHSAGPPPVPLAEIVSTIIEDTREPDGPRIDVVVCTHRHQDHVRGFELADEWAKVTVGEVWMPWTEDPNDKEATAIREAQAKRARDLRAALVGLTGVADDERERIEALIDNSMTNALAMGVLHHGFAGSPALSFLPKLDGTGGLARTVDTPLLPGVKVHVLGPPRDKDAIRNMNPPPDEAYLRAARAAGRGLPLGADLSRWAVSRSGAELKPWYDGMVAAVQHGMGVGPARTGDPEFLTWWFSTLGLKWSDLRAVDTAGEDNPLAAAVALDAAVNGTSVVLAFEIGRACLLFTGDAQWGTWKRVLADTDWRALLARTTFFKVGHHGSHNATPVDLVEKVLPATFQAMVPTRVTKKFDDIPRGPLLEAIRAKQGRTDRLVRSDDDAVPPTFRRVAAKNCIDATVPV